MAHRTATGFWALASLCGCLGLQAHAATFSINPLRMELGARQRTDVITFKNTADAPLRLQVRTMQWAVADDGQWQLTPSKDLNVTPELTEIPAGGSAQFRVGTLLDAGASERSYRLLIDELPGLDASEVAQPEIKVLTQISLPVFIEPAKRTRLPALGTVSVDHGVLAMAVGDSGTQRLDPQGIKVAVLDEGGHVLEQRDATANYVLPGRNWFLSMKLSADACRRAATVSVRWPDLANTSLSHAITTDAKACEDTTLP
jgi:fimbrial chaperone protein